jgi:hypothetical protein
VLPGAPATDRRQRLTKATAWQSGSSGSMRLGGRRIGGYWADPCVATGFGPWRVSPIRIRGRPGYRSTLKPRLYRDIREPPVRLPDPDCPTGPRHKKPRSTLRQGSSSTIRNMNMNQIRGRNRMSPRHRALYTTISYPGGDVTRSGFNPRQHHTHVQHSCRCIHVDR